MNFAEFLNPTRRKLLIAFIAFLILPNIIFGEHRSCTPWYAPAFDMPQECTTETYTAFVMFYGMAWFSVMIFDFSIFSEMLPSFIIQIIFSYVVACPVVGYFLKPGDSKKKPEKGKSKGKEIKPRKKEIIVKETKKFPEVTGEIIVLFALLFAALYENAYPMLFRSLSDLGEMDGERLIGFGAIILLSIILPIYLIYRIYKKLGGAGFKFGKIFKEKTPEAKSASNFFSGLGMFALFFILLMVVIVIIVAGPDFIKGLFAPKPVEVDGIRFVPADGWTVTKYPDPNILVEVIGPDEGNTQAYFSIEKDFYSDKTFEEAAYILSHNSEGVGETFLSTTDSYVDGKKAKIYYYRTYMEAKGYYAKGKVIVVDSKPGELVSITFVSKEANYYRNEQIADKMIASIDFKTK
ncbi:MAG: hypothetical protein Sv326_0616 [Candidatus Fermentimicrarchaeum limneticum]|uniref:Uncharacterized protein n=1 Tax=Fermentimicrarchaeum limneticum TaxID=2795018 RepID=A0A7D5XCR3_FERL1|nr:MAG: hypothetical protein Sv326_0616 [Candidatus Fermentimicrarchaeum limneticum]